MDINNIPLFVMSTDWHIEPNNTIVIKDLVWQKIELARKHNITTLIVLGDVFESRQAQPLIVIKCFEEILNMIDKAGMKLYGIPGNHDKTNYESNDSFLDQFQWHPVFKLFNIVGKMEIAGWWLYFLPYYSPQMYIDELGWLIHEHIQTPELDEFTDKEILITHTAFEGSINNDGSVVSTPVKSALFDGFFKVFSGHYHNQQQITNNIFHLASIQANNYGEDNDKGFYLFYGDGRYELIQSTFGEYHKIKINLDEVTMDEVKSLTMEAERLIKEQGANIRFDFEGSQDKVQTVKKEDFAVLGIEVKKKNSVTIKSIERAKEEKVIVYNKEIIKDKFTSFCAAEGYGKEEDGYLYGLGVLNKRLEKNG